MVIMITFYSCDKEFIGDETEGFKTEMTEDESAAAFYNDSQEVANKYQTVQSQLGDAPLQCWHGIVASNSTCNENVSYHAANGFSNFNACNTFLKTTTTNLTTDPFYNTEDCQVQIIESLTVCSSMDCIKN